MSAISFSFGHPIMFVDGFWLYQDTKEGVCSSPKRKCPECHKNQTIEGYDPCLGEIPGAMSACCGHGVTKPFLILCMSES